MFRPQQWVQCQCHQLHHMVTFRHQCNLQCIHLTQWTSECRSNLKFTNKGAREKKNIYRVEFFFSLNFVGLTNYVIRHTSQNGNMMSFSRALCTRWPRCLTSLANPLCWSLFECYALKMILPNMWVMIKFVIIEHTHRVSQPGCRHSIALFESTLRFTAAPQLRAPIWRVALLRLPRPDVSMISSPSGISFGPSRAAFMLSRFLYYWGIGLE